MYLDFVSSYKERKNNTFGNYFAITYLLGNTFMKLIDALNGANKCRK